MVILLYTDTDQIRSVLQLTEQDMPDTGFNEEFSGRELTLDLESWIPTHATVISASVAPGATAAEIYRGQVLIAYCTYFCAYQVLMTAPISIPQNISDGKNAVQRFSPEGFPNLHDYVSGRLVKYRTELLDSINNTVTAPFTKMFVRAGSAYNPVTG